ncbi:MAG TPA: alpha/beta fold hydrolase [Dehalococcoidia bacterium]|nr:alpha/beta fold hydrolase [Dehalococcoidia bacterium]
MLYTFDEYELDTGLYELRRDGTPVPLEPQVFTVLAYLIEHHERVVTKNELIDRVWPERFISEAALTSRLMAARKAVRDNGREQRYIKTVHGHGYRFAAEVRAGAPAAAMAAGEAGTATVAAGATAGAAEPAPIRTLIVDDHDVVRQGMKMYLALDPEIEIVGEAENGAEALELAAKVHPQVVLMDLLMPVMDGITATARMRDEFPDIRVIAVTSAVEEDSVVSAVRAGAIGYLLKDTRAEELRRAIKAAAAGNLALSTEATGSLTRALPASGPGIRVAGRDGGPSQEIRFCRAVDGLRIAYTTTGSGPPLVKAANWLSHLEYDHRSPIWRHWIAELSRDHMLVRYDERGCGLSEWDVEEFSLDAWVRDLETVVDTLELDRFPLLGISQGGPVAITYAVRHPERVSHLILYGTYAQGRVARAKTQGEIDEHYALNTLIRRWWGRNDTKFRQIFAERFIPGASEEQTRWFDDLCRVSASPANAASFREAFGMLDVTGIVSQVAVPTLVLHVTDDQSIPVTAGRTLASLIPGARFAELEGRNHIILDNEPAWPQFLAEVRRFLAVPYSGGVAPTSPRTILFTDLEDSTGLTRRMGDQAARDLFRQLEVEIHGLVSLHGGGNVKGLGDGTMASFKAPTRALECAVAIQRAAERLSALRGVPLRVRIGLHVGQAIVEEGDLHGIAVIVASRITGAARGGEILISDDLRALTDSKGFDFGETREFVPKGFEESMRVHIVRWAT